MGSIHEVVEALRQEPSNSERGTALEKLMVRYFELDPMLAQQYDQVSRWIDWPDCAGKADTGIDLVSRERDTGAWTAIQHRFYEPTTTLAKQHIGSFFTASGKKPFTNRKVDKTSGIVNDPNDWCDEHDDPRYIVDLIARVATVAVETMRSVDGLAAPATEDRA